jgi:hypothetical protein
MRTLLIAAGMVLLSGSLASAETWSCKQPDGTDIITNAPIGGVCKPYVSEGTMSEVPDRQLQELRMMKPAERAREIERLRNEQRLAQEVLRDIEAGGDGTGNRGGGGSTTTSPRAIQRQAGQVTFEQFRMLSTGMTEGQVLAKVGSPASRFVTSCVLTQQTVTCPTIWTYILADGWTADLTFSAGRRVDIRNTKTP